MAYSDRKVTSLEVKFDAAKTITEMRKARDEIKQFFETRYVGTKRYTEAAKLLSDVETKLQNQRKLAYSENAKMKESYFTLGTALRHNRAEMLGLVDALGFSTGGLGFTLKALAAPVGLPMFVGLLSGAAQSARDTREEIEKLIKTGVSDFFGKFGAGEISAAQSRRAVSLSKAAQERAIAQQHMVDLRMKEEVVSGYEVTDERGRTSRLMGPSPATAAEYERLDREVKAYQEINRQLEERATREEKLLEIMKQAAGLGLRPPTGLEGIGGLSTMSPLGVDYNKLRRGMARQGKGPALPRGYEVEANTMLPGRELEPKIDQTFSRITQAANQAGQAINSSITGALVKALDTGDQLADTLLNIALSLGLSFIPVIGPALAGTLGGGGNDMRVGGSSGGSFSGIARSARRSSGGGGSRAIVLHAAIKHDAIYLSNQIGGKQRSKRVLK